MRFTSSILLAFAVACLMSTTPAHAGMEVDAALNHEQARAIRPFDGTPFLVGTAKMRRHVKRCKTEPQAEQKVTQKHTSKNSKKHHKHHKSNKHKKSKSHKTSSKEAKASDKAAKSRTEQQNNDASNNDDGHPAPSAKGLLGLTFDGQCSSPDASDKYPNGNINFLNCGISKSHPGGAWNPPNVKLSQLRFVSSEQATKSGVFGACGKYKNIFDSAANSQGVPAVLLMAFAMQESSCNPSVRGGNGEIGMMQLTPDKCGGANCWDAATNVKIAAKYFKDTLNSVGGNALQAIGQYNGWQKGMTYSRATNKQWGCQAQNNLDYLNQMLNGWILGKDGHSMKVYNNLGSC